MDHDELSPQIHDFLTYYAFLTMCFMAASFWHIIYLIIMGFVTSALLFSRISTLLGTSLNSVDLNLGFQLFVFGALYGVVDYLSGIALSENHGYIMDMISFDATYFSKTTTVATVITGQGG
jgi:hypothetical protein